MSLALLEIFWLQWVAAPFAMLAVGRDARRIDPAADATCSASIRLPVSADMAYRLLDPAAPENRHQRNGLLDPLDARGARYRYVDHRLRDLPFIVTVESRSPGAAISISSVSESGEPIGAYMKTLSHFTMEPSASGGSILRQEVAMTPKPGLTALEAAQHKRLMQIGARLDLLRIRIDADAVA